MFRFRGIYRKRLVPQRAVSNFRRFWFLWWCQSLIITGGRYWSSGIINWHFFIDCQHTQGSIYALLITLLWQNYSYSITFLLYYDNKVIKRNYTIDSSLASFNQGDNYNCFIYHIGWAWCIDLESCLLLVQGGIISQGGCYINW